MVLQSLPEEGACLESFDGAKTETDVGRGSLTTVRGWGKEQHERKFLLVKSFAKRNK